jgi:hypothetical protein
MKQEYVWWATTVLTLLLTIEKLYTWATFKKKARKFIEVIVSGEGRSGRGKTLRVTSFAIQYDKKRGICKIPGYGVIAMSRKELLECQRRKLGFNVREVSGIGDTEDHYAVFSEWPV